MSVVVIGIEHRAAPLELLERVALNDAELSKVLATVRGWTNVQEAVVLSTCLRTEIYAVVDRFHEAVEDVRDLLAAHAAAPADDVERSSIVRFDDDVAIHLFSVAAGLESAVLGEGEVLGQVRRAWERAREGRVSGPVLGELFRHAVQAGKRVRSETAIARGTTSFSHAAVELAESRRPGGLAGSTVTVIGAGEMGAGVLRALASLAPSRRPRRMLVANRSVGRARQLAADAAEAALDTAAKGAPLEIEAVDIDRLDDAVGTADVVFSAVEAKTHVLSVPTLSARNRAGAAAPVLVVDLGMPRNVEPAVAALEGVTLLDMDDLRTAVGQAMDGRRKEADRAEAILAEELGRYRAASRARGAAPVIGSLRSRLEELRTAELARHRADLAELPPAAQEKVDALTRAVLAKMLHDPTVALRETAGTPRGERLVEALRTLFDL